MLTGLFSLGACDDGGCPGLSICDVAKESCQRRIAAHVSCVRGGSVKLPKVTVLDEEGLLRRFEEEDEESEEDALAYDRWNRGLALLGLASVNRTREEARASGVTDIAAAYFFRQKDIVVVDRGESLESVQAMSTFAHEMVHALQDAEYDLTEYQAKWSTSLDSSLAFRALLEGEAELYALLVNAKLRHLPTDLLDWRGFFETWQRDVLIAAENSPTPVAQAGAHFSYAFGASFVVQHWLDGGRPRIDRLFEAPPRTTREVLFGASEHDFAAEAEALRARAVPALDARFERSDATSLGAWITRVFAGRLRVGVLSRLDAARALTADEFSVHYDPEADQVVAAWRTRAESAEDTVAWPGLNSEFFHSVRDGEQPEVAMLGAEDATLDLASLAWQAPPPSEGEQESEAARVGVARPWKLPEIGRMLACHRYRPEPSTTEAGDASH